MQILAEFIVIVFILLLVQAPQTYTWFVPVAAHTPTGKGIGLTYPNIEDVSALGCDWYYDWTSSHYNDPTRYVPMSWAGEDPQLSPDYAGYLLVFNEPELKGQANLTPQQAADKYHALRAQYPKAKIILGGMGVFAQYGWFQEFDKLIQVQPQGWHLHGYTELGWTPALIDSWWRTFQGRGEVWITEFGDPKGLTIQGSELMDRARHYTRWAWFANRMTGQERWYPAGWPQPPVMNTVNQDGTLTRLGEIYRELPR